VLFAQSMKLISRKEAKTLGLKRYFTGLACQNGHMAERNTKTCACIICGTQKSLARQKANPEKAAARKRLWRQNNRERSNAYFRQWRQDNLERSTELKRDWRAKNRGYGSQWCRDNPDKVAKSVAKRKEKAAARQREWRRANRAKCQAYSLNYLARLKNAPGYFNEADIEAILEKQQYRCAAPHCQTDILRSFHIDHIMPLSRGGSNWPDNLQALCKPCNSQKRDSTMEEWLERRRRTKADSPLLSVDDHRNVAKVHSSG
jgi:5-methylcytosine-specific restriction endonuclease McrA